MKKIRPIKIRFLSNNEIDPRSAESWARSCARLFWGEINRQRKVRVEGLPGPAWHFSCSGHGGYILIAKESDVPAHFARFKDFTCRGYATYAFEEDCEWAVFEYAYPQVSTWWAISCEREWTRVAPYDEESAARVELARKRLASPELMGQLIAEHCEEVKRTVERWFPNYCRPSQAAAS